VSGKVSVFIPFHNPDDSLINAVQSVINQTYNNWELFLINDGSTNLYDKYKKYETFNKITIIEHDECRGLAVRLNEMTNYGNGDYIARMDSDDTMHPRRIEYQVSMAPDISTVITTSANLFVDGIHSGYLKGKSYDYNEISTFSSVMIIHPSIFAKREWFVNNKYNVFLFRAQDRELWLRSSNHTRFINIDKPLINYNKKSKISFSKSFQNYFYLSKALYLHSGNILVYVYCLFGFFKSLLVK
jgi:glycosyltransferase involved in cell wall biosynthesis